jgi:hypothetical protein
MILLCLHLRPIDFAAFSQSCPSSVTTFSISFLGQGPSITASFRCLHPIPFLDNILDGHAAVPGTGPCRILQPAAVTRFE